MAAAGEQPTRQQGLAEVGYERIKQYGAKEQSELRVRVKIPGSWFEGLSSGDRAKDYECEAFAFKAAHRFPKKGARAAMTCEAIEFLSKDDVDEDVTLGQYIIPLSEWNRYRHYTYKDNREAELVYIKAVTAITAALDVEAAAAETGKCKALIYKEFDLVESGTHTIKVRFALGLSRACVRT